MADQSQIIADPQTVATDTQDGTSTQTIAGPVSQMIVLAVLVSLYSLIPVTALIDFIGQFFSGASGGEGRPIIDSDGLLSLLGPLSTKEGSVLEALHKLILPLAALFVGFNFLSLKRGRWLVWLFVVPLVGTIASLVAAALLDAFASGEVRSQLPGVMTLFRDVASNLGVFLMLMIGISKADAGQAGGDNV